jgi:hypothetical protein
MSSDQERSVRQDRHVSWSTGAVGSAITVEQDKRAWELRTASLTYAQIGAELRCVSTFLRQVVH